MPESRHAQVLLFGGLRIRRGADPCAPAQTPAVTGASREMLSFLCAHVGKEIRRERIADLFWPELDQTRSRAALNTAVWRVNRAIREGGGGLSLRSTAEVLALEAAGNVSIDIELFEQAVRRGVEAWSSNPRLPGDIRQMLVHGVEHHASPFLDGYHAEWAVVERERLSSLHLRALGILMQDRGLERDYEGALEYGSRILAADPFREQVQCEVMWLHVLSGQRAKALMRYRSYRVLLQREMGIEPMAEMRALAAHIQTDPDAEKLLVDEHLASDLQRSFADVLESVSRARLDTYRTLHTS